MRTVAGSGGQRCSGNGVGLQAVVHGCGGQQHVTDWALVIAVAVVIVMIGTGVGGVCVSLIGAAGQKIDELGGDTVRAELEQETAAGSRGHIAGRNRRTQQQRRGQ